MQHIIDKKIEVKDKFDELFPNRSHTCMIYMWEDSDFKIEYRYGDGEKIHLVYYHHFVGKIEYKCVEFISNAVRIDSVGNFCYVPDELIGVLNEKEIYKRTID